MQKKTFIIANWKMNMSVNDANKFIKKLDKLNYKKKKSSEIVICAQFLLLPSLSKISRENIILGSQDCHHEIQGAFTGDSSIDLIKFFKCKYVIVGHSERRKYHYESNHLIKKKIDLISIKNLIPILCVGESMEERKRKKFKEKIYEQLNESVSNKIKRLVIAYEPIWSIGTGKIPSYEEISEISNLIKDFFVKFRKNCDLSIVYGGSVDSLNFRKISEIKNINGALIGGSSLRYGELKKIVSSIN